jgi:uncharacterized membrane protein
VGQSAPAVLVVALIPFVTAWCGWTDFARTPVACYGVVLLLNAIAYTILQATIVREHGPQSKLKAAIGRDLKGKISIAAYCAGIALAFVQPWIAVAIYVAVAIAWLVPDRRIESQLGADASG